ncbi:uncharacterized protein MYCFIDRAFT_175307 [Pseudocercospora fijiensis CIRAD86]|uniref:Uncharacterized protein n=1 Tax=Pseudocercospora fijiensis (strain CIRAD86) TaxID=383855 RepID=M3AXA4_PSEFD|nr:uncharacterized protein MYCFIDRAFT_175307 [Pseudocercospora fijiensis CIRAD86]EME81718.1 hypothetical protein MYCFIDRAFT_175307 [Pseudocercospora fijiensis CIRAD86]
MVEGRSKNAKATTNHNNVQKAEKALHQYQTFIEVQVKRSFAHPNGANIRRNAQASSDVLARVLNECKTLGDFTRFYGVLGRLRQQVRQGAARRQDRINFLKKQKAAPQHGRDILKWRAAIAQSLRGETKKSSAFNSKLGAKQTLVAPRMCPDYPIMAQSRAASMTREVDINLAIKSDPDTDGNTAGQGSRSRPVTPAILAGESRTSTATQQDPLQPPHTTAESIQHKPKRGRPSNAKLNHLASSIHNEDLAGLMEEASRMKPASIQRCSKYREFAPNGSRLPNFVLVTRTPDENESDEEYMPDDE